MPLIQSLLRGVSDVAGFLAADAQGNAAVRQVRREHDEWMRTAQLNTPYWTVNPIYPARNDMPWTYDIFGGEYLFTGPAGFGLPNQLGVATRSTTSWRLWFQHGPLTLVPQQTAASWQAAHAAGHMREMDRAAQAVLAQVQAQLAARYPATAALHA
ncbi:hypothetical protein [Kitasatospora sp. GP82]|uniref:hypothetical protein n=1 Tax=Kitasatospora sp. GP82 TaxID=3035089 RepID=UPI00247587BE|nr:hypothetical protein [Kitasatospora sp. GP82]MDH6125940.1 hypothetical protein [Kitasatospora sp. GP82]